MSIRLVLEPEKNLALELKWEVRELKAHYKKDGQGDKKNDVSLPNAILSKCVYLLYLLYLLTELSRYDIHDLLASSLPFFCML